MPYPLPDGGPPYSTALRWFLVAVPDDVAFVRAAMGAYTELASYWKWGHEGREPGRQDAAELWQGAIDATLEALEMGFPDILLSYIDGVEALLRQIRDGQCCSPFSQTVSGDAWNILIQGDDEAIPVSSYDTTSPPPDYETDPTGETPFSLSEFADSYLCAQAHLIWNVVDDMLEYGGSMHAWLNSAMSWLHHLANYLLRYLYEVSGLSQVVLFSIEELAAFNDAIAAETTASMFAAARGEWLAAKDDIVCTLKGEPTAGDWKAALETLVASNVTEAAVASILVGGLPAAVFALIFDGLLKPGAWAAEVCDCLEVVSSVSYTFDTDTEGWDRRLRSDLTDTAEGYNAARGNPAGSIWVDQAYWYVSPVLNAASHNQIRVVGEITRGNSGASICGVIGIIDEGLTTVIEAKTGACSSSSAWTTVEGTFSHSGSGPIRIGVSGSMAGDIDWDNITITFENV